MQCREEMTEDTYITMECQPLYKQLPKDSGATTTTRDEQIKRDRQGKAVREERGFECNRTRRDRPRPH